MISSEARIPTDRAQRYLDQLCGHLGQMSRHVMHRRGHGHDVKIVSMEQTADSGVVRFADGAWILEATPDALLLRVEADDPAALDRLKAAISARIAKIGRRDALTVEWRDQ